MSITIEEFEATAGPEHRTIGVDRSNEDRVLSFLNERADEAFTPGEIRVAAEIPRGSVCVALARLEDRGLVRRRGHYWAVGSDAKAETGAEPDPDIDTDAPLSN